MTAPLGNLKTVGPLLKALQGPDPLTRAFGALRRLGYTDTQLLELRRDPGTHAKAIGDLRRVGWTTDELLALGRVLSRMGPTKGA